MKRNSMLTKIIAVLLCALMVAAWLPKTSAAANDFESGMDRIYGTDAANAMPLVIGTNADSGLANAYYAYTPAEDGTLTLTAEDGTTFTVDGVAYTDAVAVTADTKYIIVATNEAKAYSFTAAFEVAPTGPETDSTLTVSKVAFGLNGYIGAQVQLTTAGAKKYDEVYVEVNNAGVVTKLTDNIGAAYSMFIYEHRMVAKQMGDIVTITPYGVLDGVISPGVPYEWSIKEGALAILDRDIEKTDAKSIARCKLCVEMLYYGAEAQKKYLTEGTYTLVTENLDDDYVALHATADPVISATSTTVGSNKNELTKYALGIADVVEVQFLFNLGGTDYTGYEAKVVTGGQTYTIDTFTKVTSTKAVAIFNQILAKGMRDTVTVELYKDGASVSPVYTTSIEAIAAGMLSGNNANLVKAMITYGDAANAFVNAK